MLFANNCNTTLNGGITAVATSMVVTSATGFPTPTGSQYFYCTLADATTQTTIEIVKVTAVSGTTFTIVRGQDGTTGTIFASGDVVSLRLVRASLNDFPKLDEANTFTGDITAPNILTTGHIGINTATVPTILMRAVGDNNSLSRIAMRGYSSDSNSSSIRVSKFRGTVAAPQAPISGDSLGKFELAGYGTTSADAYPQVSLEGVTTEVWGATARGAKAVVKVTPNTTITQVTALTIDQDSKATFANTVTANGVLLTGNTGTVTSVAALTLGTTGTDLSSTVANGTTTPVITLQVPTASATNRGALSSTDWSTFNGKAPSVTYTTGYVPYGQGTTTLNQSSNLFFDGTKLGIGTSSPSTYATLAVTNGSASNGIIAGFFPNATTINRGVALGTTAAGAASIYGWIPSTGAAADLVINPLAGALTYGSGQNSVTTTFTIAGHANLFQQWTTGISGRTNWGLSREYVAGGDMGFLRSSVANGTPDTTVLYLAPSGGVSIGNTTDAGAGNLSVTGTGKFGTTVGVGAATPSTSGSGVTFPATQSASTDVNTLDDYEEGTWTPGVGNLIITGTPTFTGTYTKIGRIVYFSANLSTTGTITSTAGTSFINSGFPYVSALAVYYVTPVINGATIASIGNGLTGISGGNTIIYMPTIAGVANVIFSGMYMTPT